MSIPERLAKKINVTDDCWYWTGQQTHNGYGQVYDNYTTRMAHRVVYEVLVGEIPEGMTLDHLCRNRLCVNPKHVEPVTIGENIRRAPRATNSTCKYGHPYKEQSNSYKTKGARRCHTCHALKESLRRKERIAS